LLNSILGETTRMVLPYVFSVYTEMTCTLALDAGLLKSMGNN